MYIDVYKKYVNNFKTILPFILVKVGIDLLNYFSGSSVKRVEKYDMVFGIGEIIRNMEIQLIVLGLFLFISSPIIYAFMALLCKKILKDEEDINLVETLRESTHYYFRYIGLSLIIGAIMIGISLFMILTGGMFLLIIPVVLFLLYFAITAEPCTEYLVYSDNSVEEAFSGGRKIGKKYFWQIVGLNIIITLISLVFKSSFFLNMPGLLIVSFITAIIQGYVIMFRMNLCTLEN